MIKSILRFLLTLALIAIVGLGVLAVIAWSVWPLDGTSFAIDREGLTLSGLQGWHPLAAVGFGIVAAVVGICIAILAVSFALVSTALGLGLALLAVAGSLGLVATPFLLVGWLVWRLARPRPMPAASPAAGALPAA
jgi:hypothetical protein